MKNSIYKFLPFRFDKIGDRILLTNETGEFYFLDNITFSAFIQKKLDKSSQSFLDLKSKYFIYTRIKNGCP